MQADPQPQQDTSMCPYDSDQSEYELPLVQESGQYADQTRSVSQFDDKPEVINSHPAQALGLIAGKNTEHNQTVFSTGFLISSTLVLTAAHALFIRKGQFEELVDLRFHPKCHGELKEPIKIKRAIYPKQYTTKEPNRSNQPKSKQVMYDYGLAILEKPVELDSYLQLIYDFQNYVETIELWGYLTDGHDSHKANLHRRRKAGHHSTIAISKGTKQIYYLLPTEVGLSGSPILTKDNKVVAIHKGCSMRKSTQRFGGKYSAGRLIDTQLIKTISKWAMQSQADASQILSSSYNRSNCQQIQQELHRLRAFELQNLWSVPLEDHLEFPHNCIGVVSFRYKGSANILKGNGILISENFVLTPLSSVCLSVFNRQHFTKEKLELNNQQDFCITFDVGFRGALDYQYKAKTVFYHASAPAMMVQSSNLTSLSEQLEVDYCLIELSEPIKRPQYPSLTLYENMNVNQCQLVGYGRPEVKNSYEQKKTALATAYFDIFEDKKMIAYRVGTSAGMSGSPIIDQKGRVMAIHKFGASELSVFRGGRLITVDMFYRIMEWSESTTAVRPTLNFTLQQEEEKEVRSMMELRRTTLIVRRDYKVKREGETKSSRI